MSPRSPRSPASAGSRSRPARLGRPSRRCWSRRGCPARSTTACSAAWTARALAGRSGRTRRPRTRPAPGGCRAGRGRPAGVGPTQRPAPGKGTRPAGNEREGQPRRGLALSRGAGGPALLSWGRREQSTDGPGGEGCRRDHSHVRCPGRAREGRHPAPAHRPWPRRRGRAPLPPASPGQGRRRRHLRSRGRPRGAPHPVQPRVATSSFETYLTRGGANACRGFQHRLSIGYWALASQAPGCPAQPVPVQAAASGPVPGARLACPALRPRAPVCWDLRRRSTEPAPPSLRGHRVGTVRAALPRAAGVQHRPPSCSGRPVRPSARPRVSPTPLLAARGWHLRAGRGRRGQQCPAQGGPLLGPQALPRLSAGKDCRRARGLAAGARRCLYLSGGRLGSRAESQVLTGPRGPASAPRVRRSVRRDRSCSPHVPTQALGRWPSSSRPPRITVPLSSSAGPHSAGRTGLAAATRSGAWASRWAWGTGGRAPSELGLQPAGTAPACPSPAPWRPPAEALGAATWPSSRTSCPHRTASPLLSGVTVSRPQL